MAARVQTQDYQCTIAARISPAEAFEGIARPGHRMVKRDFTGRDRKAGDTFTVRFGKTFVDFKIAEAIAPTHAVWQLTDSNLEWLQAKKEWTGMTVVWDISSDDGGTTQVRMTHVGLVPRDRVLQRVQAGAGTFTSDRACENCLPRALACRIRRTNSMYSPAKPDFRSAAKLRADSNGIRSKGGVIMAKVVFGNHAAVIVPRQDRDRIRKFYSDVLGCTITRESDQRDFLRMGDNFYIAFMYGDDADESELLRTGKSVWLEIKSDDVEEMRQKILDFGVRRLDIPDPHLYFQAPGGQVLRLVSIDEDLSEYEGNGEGPNVGKVKEAIEGQ